MLFTVVCTKHYMLNANVASMVEICAPIWTEAKPNSAPDKNIRNDSHCNTYSRFDEAMYDRRCKAALSHELLPS